MSSPNLSPDLRDILAGLDDAQQEAVLSPAPHLAILAGAGSGKTRVLTRRLARRIADGSAAAGNILAVTFTNKAACEMRGRLAVMLGEDLLPRRRRGFMPRRVPGPSVHTLHAFGYAILVRYWDDTNQPRAHLLQRQPARLQDALTAIGESVLTVDALRTEIGWAKARVLSAAEYPAAAEEHQRAVVSGGQLVDLGTVSAAFHAYEQLLRRRNVIDLDDLIVDAIQVLDANPGFLAAQRWWYRHVFVDEYQDLNPAQFRLLRTVLSDESDLCVVGDPNQAIFGWNGADPRLLLDFTTHFPGAEVLRLDANFRCRRPIVAAAATVLDLPVAPVRDGAEDGAIPTLSSFEDERAEAEEVARAIHRMNFRYGAQAIGVLAPTAAQLDLLALALDKRGVVFERAGSSLLQRREVIRVLHRLRELQGPRNGRPLADSCPDIEELCDRSARDMPLDNPEWWDGYDEDGESIRIGLTDDDPRFLSQKASLDNLVELLEEFFRALPRGDLQVFETWATAELGRREAGLRGTGVVLSSIHRAKGLEWSVVFVIGCVDGALPDYRVRTAEARDESRRLAYVALTRASDELFCTWSKTRVTPWGAVQETKPSPFLRGLAQADGSTGITSVQQQPKPLDREAIRRMIDDLRSHWPPGESG